MPQHIIDLISSGRIVEIRDHLMKLQAEGRDVSRLESGDPSFEVPDTVEYALREALAHNHTHYTESAGITALRESILIKVRSQNCLASESVDDIVVTSGAMHGLYLVFSSILNAHDYNPPEVIIPDPMWTEIAEIIRLAGGVPIKCSLDDDLRYNPKAIKELITSRTVAIFINSPHNPTGAVSSLGDLQEIASIAKEHSLLIVSDEAYEHLILDENVPHVSIGSITDARDRTISLFSASKSYAMSGLRIGYVVAPPMLRRITTRIKKLCRCTTNGVNSMAQYGLKAALDYASETELWQKTMVQTLIERRDVLLSAFENQPYFEPHVPNAGFFLWVKINKDWPGSPSSNGKDAGDEFCRMLLERGVGSVPGSVFGDDPRYIRFSFSCTTDHVVRAAGVIRDVINGGAR